MIIALAGTIETGLFLGSGRALATGGPLGPAPHAHVPLSGSIFRQAEYLFDPTLSFAQGWNTIYGNCVGLPCITAAVLRECWTTSVNNGVWITILALLVIMSNLFFVRSPFVIAASNAGISVVPHIVNAVVLTSAWLSANSGMLGGSRTLYGLAREDNASTVFLWFQDLVSAAALIGWCIICLVYLVGFLSFALILTAGYPVFTYGEWDTETFIFVYFNTPLIFILSSGCKWIKGMKVVSYNDMPIWYYLDIAKQNSEPPETPLCG
ncbi:hypothetical protein BT96DRAFT_1084982 [Gymnopus androsaceus JB14]|uniref:Amino acid permease/ SLC12A domain-containing protein n=1 Tax=Gymnopus androsaceus JB14 TaxID=1447944 RepID=A0A6A4IHV4_9AGAR|nr:hypothetical protein BT96DRAFT_1084982 [Gymnopus androsaceus JB14]